MMLSKIFQLAKDNEMEHLSIGWTSEEFHIMMREEGDKIATSFRFDSVEAVETWCEEWLPEVEHDEDCL